MGMSESIVDELKQKLSRTPFQPFVIVLRNGRRLSIVRKFQMAIGLTRFTFADPESHTFSDFALDQIVSLEGPETDNAVIEDLKRRLHPSRFAPFRLVFRNGEQLDVVRPLQMGIGLTKLGYIYPDGRGKVERKLADLVSLDSLEPASAE